MAYEKKLHDKTFGMDGQNRPNLIDQSKWRVQFGMRNKDGYLRQVPRRVVYNQISTYHSQAIKNLVAVPSAGGLTIPLAMTDHAVYSFDSTGFRSLQGGLKSSSAFYRWGTCLYNEYLYFTNPLNKVMYTDGVQVRDLGENVPTGRYVEVFFEHLVVAGGSYKGVSEPTVARWSSLYDFTVFDPNGKNEADSYDFADYGRGDCAGVGLTGLKRLGDNLFFFTPSYIAPMSYIGLPTVMRVGEPVVKDKGNSFPYSMVGNDSRCFFVDETLQTFFSFDGQQATEIGKTVGAYFFSILSTVPSERAKTTAYIDPVETEVHWLFVSKNSTSSRFDMEIVFNYEENTWYVSPVEDVHCFLPSVRVAASNLSTKGSAGNGQSLDSLGYAYLETLPKLYGFRNGRLLREETDADALSSCLTREDPYLETGDYHYGTLANKKEIESEVIHASVKEDSNLARMEVRVSTRNHLEEDVVFTKMGQIFSGNNWPIGLFSGPNRGGNVWRQKFLFAGSTLSSTTTFTPPTGFTPLGFNGPVTALAVDSAGKVYVGGYFDKYNGVSCPNGLVRLNTDGTRDTSFAPVSFYINGSYPVPTQIVVTDTAVYVGASRSYTIYAKTVKQSHNFGLVSNVFSAPFESSAYIAPPLLKMSLTGVIDTSFLPPFGYTTAATTNRFMLLAFDGHPTGRLVVSVTKTHAAATSSSLWLTNQTTGTTLHSLDTTAPLPGMEPGFMDVKVFPNGDLMMIHQDQGSGIPISYSDTLAAVFDPINKQGAMMHVFQVVNDKFVLDVGFVLSSKWEFQVLGDDKYGLADVPYRLAKELLYTSPIVTTKETGDAQYYGKWGNNAPGSQIGLVFWNGDPSRWTYCWNTANGTYNSSVWQKNGVVSSGTDDMYSSTVMAEPLCTVPSIYESSLYGKVENDVGLFVTGLVASYKGIPMTSFCATPTLSISGSPVTSASFRYFPLFKLKYDGSFDNEFQNNLFEYREADGTLISGTQFAGLLYPGRPLCAVLMADRKRLVVGGLFSRINGTVVPANLVVLDAVTGEVINGQGEFDNDAVVSYELGGSVRRAVFAGYEELIRLSGEA